MLRRWIHTLNAIIVCNILCLAQHSSAQEAGPSDLLPASLRVPNCAKGNLRVATFNASLNRNKPGELRADLDKGDKQIRTVAAIIRAVRPDVLLINEFDYQDGLDLANMFADRYLADEKVDVLGGGAWPMQYRFTTTVNTGVLSGWISTAMASPRIQKTHGASAAFLDITDGCIEPFSDCSRSSPHVSAAQVVIHARRLGAAGSGKQTSVLFSEGLERTAASLRRVFGCADRDTTRPDEFLGQSSHATGF